MILASVLSTAVIVVVVVLIVAALVARMSGRDIPGVNRRGGGGSGTGF